MTETIIDGRENRYPFIGQEGLDKFMHAFLTQYPRHNAIMRDFVYAFQNFQEQTEPEQDLRLDSTASINLLEELLIQMIRSGRSQDMVPLLVILGNVGRFEPILREMQITGEVFVYNAHADFGDLSIQFNQSEQTMTAWLNHDGPHRLPAVLSSSRAELISQFRNAGAGIVKKRWINGLKPAKDESLVQDQMRFILT